MKRKLALTVLLLSCVSLPLASANLRTASRSGGDVQAVLQADRTYITALRAADVNALNKLFADDYTVTKSTGEHWNKAKHLAYIKSGEHKFLKLGATEVKPRLYGNVAVVTGSLTWDAHDENGNSSGHSRYTHVYVKRNGRWQMVQNHFNRYNP
jgi:ketosteroid isomerase-like protein